MDDASEWLKMWAVNCGVVATVSLTDIELVLKIIALLLTVAWSAVKLHRLLKE